MTASVRKLVQATSVYAAAVGFLLSPLPLGDELVLLPTHLGLGAIIGRDHGLAWNAIPWKALAKTAVLGLAARATVTLTVSYVPGVAALVSGGTAYAVTRAYAKWADVASAHPREARVPRWDDLVALLRSAAGGDRKGSAANGDRQAPAEQPR